MAKIYPLHIILFYVVPSYYETKIWTAKNRLEALQNPVSVKWSDKIVIQGYKNAKERQGEMILWLKLSGISGKVYLK